MSTFGGTMGYFSRLFRKTEEKTDAKMPLDEIKTFVFNDIPKTLDDLKNCQGGDLRDPFATAALLVVALCVYPNDNENAIEMIDYLNGPNPVNDYGRRYLKDRFVDADYVPRSFFEGAVPENNYKPSLPYTINVTKSAYQEDQNGYLTLWFKSGGSDTSRSVTLRNKPSTGEWFVNSYQLLGQIKAPKFLDPWA